MHAVEFLQFFLPVSVADGGVDIGHGGVLPAEAVELQIALGDAVVDRQEDLDRIGVPHAFGERPPDPVHVLDGEEIDALRLELAPGEL